MHSIDQLLTQALSPEETMSEELKARILQRTAERKEQNLGQITEFTQKRRRFSAAAVVAAAVLAVSSVTALAAWKTLSARDVAEKLQDERLTAAFAGAGAWEGAETQSSGGYDVSLLGLVSGEGLSDSPVTVNGKTVTGGAYAVVAIARADGTPMSYETEDGAGGFFVSPYIRGCDPALVNAVTLEGGGYAEIIEDGVLYRLVHVENIEAFAGRGVYLGVSDGTFYNSAAFLYDAATGELGRNPAYTGVNALFTLPVDGAKADEAKAAEILQRIENPVANESDADVPAEVRSFLNALTPENIGEYAAPIESTRQTLTPDANGYYSYRYTLSDGAGGSGTFAVSAMFPEGKTGMSEYISCSLLGESLEDGLLLYTHTLNADGTVTFVVYTTKN